MSERFSDDERFEVAAAIRDWIHKQPWSECGPGADTCPDWPKAFEIRDVALAALDATSPKPVEVGYVRRDTQSAGTVEVQIALLEEARDSCAPGDAKTLLSRVIDAALGSEGGEG